MSEQPQQTRIERPQIFTLPKPATSVIFRNQTNREPIAWVCYSAAAAEELLKWLDIRGGMMVYDFSNGQITVYCNETNETILNIYKEYIDQEVDQVDPQLATDITKTAETYRKRQERGKRSK